MVDELSDKIKKECTLQARFCCLLPGSPGCGPKEIPVISTATTAAQATAPPRGGRTFTGSTIGQDIITGHSTLNSL